MPPKNKSSNKFIRAFDITPCSVLYKVYKNSAEYFISCCFYNKIEEYLNAEDVKKKVQAWNYIKAMVKLLRERELWDYKTVSPLGIKDKDYKKYITCASCFIDYKIDELLTSGSCPVCGLKLIKGNKNEQKKKSTN